MRDLIGGGFLLGGIVCFLLAAFGAGPVQAPWLILFGIAFMLIGYPIMYRRR